MLHKQLIKWRKGLAWIPYCKRNRVNGGRTLDVWQIISVVFEPASAVKSLTLFLPSFLRCHKDIANYTGSLGIPGQT